MHLKYLKLSRFFLHALLFLKKYSLFILLGALVLFSSIFAERGLYFMKKLAIKPVDLLGFFGKGDGSLDSQAGVTNFLVLGIRGEGSDSPKLTDSMILISLDQNNNKISQIGIPRDLWVPSLQAKINTAYYYGEEASPGAGITLAQSSVLEDLGLPVNYTVVVNFTLFKSVVDLLGGVDINVSPGFEDKEFPIPGRESALPISSRYETITFPEGQNHLNGDQALKFVRSRHSVGDEGTDFARSRRQQQIISAVRSKIFSKEFLLDQNKVNGLLNIVQSNLKTNLPSSLYPLLARLGLELSGNSINVIPLSTVPDKNGVSILYNPPVSKYKGEWVLIPKDNNWSALKQYIKNNLTN